MAMASGPLIWVTRMAATSHGSLSLKWGSWQPLPQSPQSVLGGVVYGDARPLPFLGPRGTSPTVTTSPPIWVVTASWWPILAGK